jgi:DUF2905 family protein
VETLGKALLGFAVVLAALGCVLLLISRFGISRLPGDIVIRGKDFTVYLPLGLSILLSLLLTILLNLFPRQ